MKKQILMFMFSTLDDIPPVINEGTSLTKSGYTFRFLGLRYHPHQPGFEEAVPGFYIHRMKLITRTILGENDLFQSFRYAEFALRSFLWGLFRRADLFIGYDLVTLPYVYPLALLKRKPVVYRAGELWGEQTPGIRWDNFWKRLDRFFCPRVDALVAPEVNRASIYFKEYGAVTFPTVVFNCPVFIPRPAGSHLRQILKEKGIRGNFIVYYQGGVGSARKIDKLIEAMSYMPDDVALVLVGRITTSFEQWMNDTIAQRNFSNRVLYMGFLTDGSQRFELCAGADVGVTFVREDCRNYQFHATASNKLFEYMMMGLPILATDLPSYRDIVESEKIGVCVDSSSPRAIADGILQLYNNPEKVKQMRMNGLRLTADRYNWDKEFPKLLQLYENLMRRK